ncbi:MAG: cytochrome c biogenesis protein CcsA [Anaerolineaceae bacterium]|nr:cytochrome c biogenesis protein CcsA [Anaerolineaceae bacterium]
MTAIREHPAQIRPAANQTGAEASPRPNLLIGLSILSAAGLLAGLVLALTYAGTDAIQGDVQRLFYFHVPSIMGAFVAFTLGLIGSLGYLFTNRASWDRLALAAIEVGFVLALINVLLGSIWARPTWNTWWTDDPRMVASAVMMLICLAYLMLRHGLPDGNRRVAAVLGIVLMGAVIATFLITRLRADTIHPVVIGPSPQNSDNVFGMTPPMGITFGFNMAVWALLLAPTLIWWRVRLERLAERVNRLNRGERANQ